MNATEKMGLIFIVICAPFRRMVPHEVSPEIMIFLGGVLFIMGGIFSSRNRE